MRLLSLVLGVTMLAHAPLQCSHDPEPDARRYETPPEALYTLAQRLQEKGDRQGYRETLAFLVERYPNSRFALRAQEELAGSAAAAASAGVPPGVAARP